MLERIKTIPVQLSSLVSRISRPCAKPTLINMCRSLRIETRKSLATLATRSTDLYPVHELHIAIDNLTNVENSLRRYSQSNNHVGAEFALKKLDEQFEQTASLLKTGDISTSIDAGETVMRTLNLLFAAKQKVKQNFGIITPLNLNGKLRQPDNKKPARLEITDASALPPFSNVSEIVLPAAMLFQLRQSLFPAERMMVGAARKIDGIIAVEALFDVTGAANAVGVKADPNRLATALIAMAETETYFGLWIHSHPGTGAGGTHPSGIDLDQHDDWLRDYSADLVSAIMVKDRYIRFWGTAVESGKIAVRIEGAGVECISPPENIYRLGN